jgi:hypothetical protein
MGAARAERRVRGADSSGPSMGRQPPWTPHYFREVGCFGLNNCQLTNGVAMRDRGSSSNIAGESPMRSHFHMVSDIDKTSRRLHPENNC